MYMVSHIINEPVKSYINQERKNLLEKFNEYGTLSNENEPHLTLIPPTKIKPNLDFFNKYKVNKTWKYFTGEIKTFSKKVIYLECTPNKELKKFLQKIEFEYNLKPIILHATLARKFVNDVNTLKKEINFIEKTNMQFDNIYLMKLNEKKWVKIKKLI